MLEVVITAALAMGIQFHENKMDLTRAEVIRLKSETGVDIMVIKETPSYHIIVLPGEMVRIVGNEDVGANRGHSPKF